MIKSFLAGLRFIGLWIARVILRIRRAPKVIHVWPFERHYSLGLYTYVDGVLTKVAESDLVKQKW